MCVCARARMEFAWGFFVDVFLIWNCYGNFSIFPFFYFHQNDVEVGRAGATAARNRPQIVGDAQAHSRGDVFAAGVSQFFGRFCGCPHYITVKHVQYQVSAH